MVLDFRIATLLCKAGLPGLLFTTSMHGEFVGSWHYGRGFKGSENQTWSEKRRGTEENSVYRCSGRIGSR